MEPKIVWLFIFVSLYWSFCIFWGLKGALATKTAKDFFTAGGNLPVWVYVLAATATSFSGWTFVGHPGLIYQEGFQYAFISFYAILIPLTGVVFLKRQWLLGKRFKFSTPGEMLATYFQSNTIRFLVVVVALFFAIPYLALQMRAAGFLFSALTDNLLPLEVGMWLLAGIILFNVVVGGLKAVAYIEVFQVVLLVIGMVLLGWLSVDYLGGWHKFQLSLAALADFDLKRTSEGFSHYFAIPSFGEWTNDGSKAAGGSWTTLMVMTYLFGMMGIQAAPTFSMWAFSAESPRSFAPQQVWASALVIGFIMIFFSAMQGMSGHFLGGNVAFMHSHPELVKNVMAKGLQSKDLLETVGESDVLVPQLIYLFGQHFPWLAGLLAICALAAMQATGAAYLSTSSSILATDFFQRYFPNLNDEKQKLAGRFGIVIVLFIALWVATVSQDSLVLLGGLAVAYGCQMWPALLGVCYFPWLTGAGIVAGLIAGILAVTLTDSPGQFFLNLPWGRWPLTIHSAGWGIFCNLLFALIVSLFSQNISQRTHRLTFHQFLRENTKLSEDKQRLKVWAWLFVIIWFGFSIGPGAMFGNALFGHPHQPQTWVFFIPSIWAWQILWWGIGVYMMWFLAYKMEMATVPEPIVKMLNERKNLL